MWRVVLLSWWLLGTLALCCPPDCRCYTDDDGYKVANCSKTGLITGGLFPTIEVLNFKNQLRGSQTKLEARIFRNFRALQVLNLQNSSISHLPSDVFLGIGRVVRIDLSFNKIKHLNGVVFKPLQNLKELNLRGNSLSMSPLEVIVSDTLEQLDMGYCNINSLPLFSFSSVPSLRHLILDGNSIQTIEYNVLPKGLTYINLALNHIVEPPINVFNSLRYLFRLDLSHNPINCSCALLAFQDSLSGRAGILENGITCANPPHLVGRSINSVNENQLCRHDYGKDESSNSLPHSRRSQYHRYYDIQSDEPLMGDESYGTRDAAEVMFTNDETNQMGTHMEARIGAHLGGTHTETDGTTIIHDNNNESPESDPPQDLTVDHHPSSPEDVEDTTKPEELALGVSSQNPDDPIESEKTTVTEEQQAAEESYSGNDNIINLSSSDPLGGKSDHSNTLHALDVGFNSTDPSSQAVETGVWSTNGDKSDVELLANTTMGDEPISNLELSYDDTTTESSSSKPTQQYILPTSATEPADYSYDTQHDDYTALHDNVSSSELLGEGSVTNHGTSTTSATPEEEVEGSGEPETTTEFEKSSSGSTVGFMEEHEAETEPSLQTVSDDLVDVWSTTAVDGLLLISSTETTPSVEPSTDISSEDGLPETSSIEPSSESYTEAEGTEPSLVPSSTEPSSTPDEVTQQPTTEMETSPEPTTELPIVEISSEPSSTTVEVTEPPTTSEMPSSSESPKGFWWESPSSSTETSSTYRKGKMIEITTEATKDNEIEVSETFEESAKNGKIQVDPSQSEDRHNYLTSGITFILIGVLIAIVMVLLTIIMCRKKKTTTKIRLPPVDPEAANGTELQDMLLPKPLENGIKALPKAYTNGTTPVSNGKAKEIEANKEESVPVLAPEPEPEPEIEPVWDDKPEPIEAVTARLTMLARPQTPIFIQKSLT